MKIREERIKEQERLNWILNQNNQRKSQNSNIQKNSILLEEENKK